MANLYRIIDFKVKHGNCGGSLVQFQQGEEAENALPFPIGKVLVSSDMQPGDVRGNHAHHETEEIVVALSGGCTFELDDGRGTSEIVRLSANAADHGLLATKRHEETQKLSDSPESNFLYPSQDETGSLDLSGVAPDSHTPTPPKHSDTQAALLLYPHIWRTFYDFEPGTVLLVVANITYDEKDYVRDRTEFERLAKTWSGLGGSSARCAEMEG